MFYYPKKEWKENVSLPAYEDVYFYADGDTIHGIFCKPEVTPIATIYYVHGNSGNISIYDGITTTLVNAGFQLFMVDFRGFGKSTGTPTHLNIAKDGQQAFDYLVNRPDVEGTKLIMYGASIGTQLAAKLANDNQNRVYALVLEDGMSSFTDIAITMSPEDQQDMIREHLISPYSSKASVAEIENMPKLIMHAKNDKIVPFKQGQAVFDSAKEPKTFLPTADGHLDVLRNDPESAIQAIYTLLGISK